MPRAVVILVLICFPFLTACARSGIPVSATPPSIETRWPTPDLTAPTTEILGLSPEADRYLSEALDIMAKHSINQNQIDWDTLRAAAYHMGQGAQTRSDTYPAIRSALLRLGDRHSLFYAPEAVHDLRQAGVTENPVPEVRLLQDRIAYVLLPAYRGIGQAQGNEYASDLQQKMRELDDRDPIGWVVDLRKNTGGNMWPMLAGIGPVLGEGRLGAFVRPDGQAAYRSYSNGEAKQDNAVVARVDGQAYQLRRPLPPVAVLTSPATASSGEAIVVAFRERSHTRSFGEATAGRSTANAGFDLRDGAMIFLTVATFADRTGRTYGGPIAPDQVMDPHGNVPDPVLQGAIQWLLGR
jgi:carboxyl-terminal processing protease